MADLRRMQLAISKGMKLYCTVEQALEDVIVVSLKHKTKEFRGILLDSSQRHLPPGLTFPKEGDPAPSDAATAGNSGADGPDQLMGRDVKGVTLACRYSYNNDPAKYNEQPLAAHPSISIRSSRGKTVRNIRLRPRQTLCSKCKSMIHDNKSKSPSKAGKPEGDAQGETNYHNTRYRAAQSGKAPDISAPEPMLTRAGLRNKRLEESNPKVLLENIRPKREPKPSAKRKASPEGDGGGKGRSERKGSQQVDERGEESVDSVSQSGRSGVSRTDSDLTRSSEENSHVMVERSVSLDNSTALHQYNKQPVVRLEKSLIRTEDKTDKTTERIPTLQIANIPRPSPAIKISYGDGAVLKIPPRLPGAELKSPEGHSTADESPVPNSPAPEPSPPARKTKKASRKSRDKQRYRIVDSEVSSEPQLAGIKITAAHHRKHKRKHKHRHANTEDENFNSESGQPPPSKFPAIITKFSRVPPVNDMNGNEQKNESDVLKEDSQSQQDSIFGKVDRSPTVSDLTQTDEHTRTEDDQIFEDDPLRIEGLPIPESIDPDQPGSGNLNPRQKEADQTSVKAFDFGDDTKENKVLPGVSHQSPAGSESRSLDIWCSPVKIETPAFEIGGSPARIEAPPFPTDESQDGSEAKPFSMKSSPGRQEEDSRESSPPAWVEEEEKKEEPPETDEEDKKESVPYGTGVFEDLTPDEDEDSHDDRNVSQPLYQLPLTKKPRLLYGWHQEEGVPHHMASYFPKAAAARVITDNSSSLYQKSSRVYSNGPSSYFSGGSSSTSVYPNSPASAFPNSPASVFQNSPAPRIQNSPTPIIQKSPVPIFQYHGSSRYQGSPGRRYGSSPSRRYPGVGESTGRYHTSLVDAGALQRHSTQSSASHYQTHSHSEAEPSRFRAPENLPAADFARVGKDSDTGHSAAQFQTKFDSRSAVRFPPLGEGSASGRYQAPSESGAARLSVSEDSNSVSSSVRYQSLGENSSSTRFPASTDRSALPVYLVQNVGGSSQQKYLQGSGSSALSPGYPAHQSLGESSLPAHSHTQYKSLNTSDSRFPTQSDDRYQTVPGLPPALTVQPKRTPPVAAHRSDGESKDALQSVSRFSDSLGASSSAAVFLSQTSPAVQAHSSSVPKFHTKMSAAPLTHRSLSVEATKPLGVSGSAPSQQVSSAFYSDHKHDLSLAQDQAAAAGLFRSQGQPGVILARGQSVPGVVSQSQSHFTGGTISDSDDDESDTAVPGFTQLPAHIEGDASRPMMKIQTQSLTKCYNSRRREIRVGDVVWGKVQGFPWWPGRVMAVTVTQRDHRDQDPLVTQQCTVTWFGSSTMSYMAPADLHPFLEDFAVRYNKKKRGPYRTAIQQALLAAQGTSAQQSTPEPLQTLNLQDLVT